MVLSLLTHGAVVALRAEQTVHYDDGPGSLQGGLLWRILALEGDFDNAVRLVVT